jgi:hypothetical protein
VHVRPISTFFNEYASLVGMPLSFGFRVVKIAENVFGKNLPGAMLSDGLDPAIGREILPYSGAKRSTS